MDLYDAKLLNLIPSVIHYRGEQNAIQLGFIFNHPSLNENNSIVASLRDSWQKFSLGLLKGLEWRVSPLY
jgi:hypothetical protein